MCACVRVCVGVLVICILYSEVFPCFFLSCNANSRVKLAKTGHGPHSSILFICVVQLLFLLFCVLFVCKCVLPTSDNPTEVNKHIKYAICFKIMTKISAWYFAVTSRKLHKWMHGSKVCVSPYNCQNLYYGSNFRFYFWFVHRLVINP